MFMLLLNFVRKVHWIIGLDHHQKIKALEILSILQLQQPIHCCCWKTNKLFIVNFSVFKVNQPNLKNNLNFLKVTSQQEIFL